MAQQLDPTGGDRAHPGGWEGWLRWRVLETPTLGAFCIVLGAGAAWIARKYPYGTLLEMGPGFVPTAIALILIFFGVLILVLRGRDANGEERHGPDDATAARSPLAVLRGMARVMVFVLGAIVLFGLTLRPLGLAPSTFLLVAVASMAHPEARLVPVFLIATGLTVAACLLFVVLLGLTIPILPQGLLHG